MTKAVSAREELKPLLEQAMLDAAQRVYDSGWRAGYDSREPVGEVWQLFANEFSNRYDKEAADREFAHKILACREVLRTLFPDRVKQYHERMGLEYSEPVAPTQSKRME